MVRIEVTQAEAESIMFGLGSIGYCRSCGTEQGGCEPDARRYRCEACGAHEVYGFEELLIMGEVDLT